MPGYFGKKARIHPDWRLVLIFGAELGCTAMDKQPDLIMESTLTCPRCGHQATETMPTDACQFFYDCKGCGERLKPLPGDCCVFCSYGSVPCPPIQANAGCCS